MNYKDYPIGTKTHASMGGHWIKTDRGWKWCTDDTFPTPEGNMINAGFPGSGAKGRCFFCGTTTQETKNGPVCPICGGHPA